MAYPNGFSYRYPVMIHHAYVHEDITSFDFPLTIFANTAHVVSGVVRVEDLSGIVQASVVESYDSWEGRLVVRIKTNLSSTVDTVLYLYVS